MPDRPTTTTIIAEPRHDDDLICRLHRTLAAMSAGRAGLMRYPYELGRLESWLIEYAPHTVEAFIAAQPDGPSAA